MFRYFPGQANIKRSEFIREFDDEDVVFMNEDLYNLRMIYFINKFLMPDLSRNFIFKNHFDLVESGEYLNSWGNEWFKILLDTCSHRLKTNPSSFTFGGSIFLYKYDFISVAWILTKSVATHVGDHSPNWKTSQELIYNDFLKRIMFKQCSKFETLLFSASNIFI